jgi:hypothetical protein
VCTGFQLVRKNNFLLYLLAYWHFIWCLISSFKSIRYAYVSRPTYNAKFSRFYRRPRIRFPLYSKPNNWKPEKNNVGWNFGEAVFENLTKSYVPAIPEEMNNVGKYVIKPLFFLKKIENLIYYINRNFVFYSPVFLGYWRRRRILLRWILWKWEDMFQGWEVNRTGSESASTAGVSRHRTYTCVESLGSTARKKRRTSKIVNIFKICRI